MDHNCSGSLFKEKNNQQKEEARTKEQRLELNAIFKKGDYGYNCFRIPAAIIANNGDVLIFAEARKNSCSDTGNIDLVMRRSTDNGKSWGPINVIWDDGENVCGNPAPV